MFFTTLFSMYLYIETLAYLTILSYLCILSFLSSLFDLALLHFLRNNCALSSVFPPPFFRDNPFVHLEWKSDGSEPVSVFLKLYTNPPS